MSNIQSTFNFTRSGDTPSTTKTVSVTVAAGSGRVLVVGMAAGKFSVPVVTGITYNGTALTQGQSSAGVLQPMVRIWYLNDPPVGTANLVVTYSSNSANGSFYGAVLDGMNTAVAPTGAGDEQSSGTATSPAVTVPADDIAIIVANSLGGTAGVQAGTTAIALGVASADPATSVGAGGYRTSAAPGLTFASGQLASATMVFRSATPGDTTPPTLTSPTGTGGSLVCSGTVSSNEGNGTLYAVATASATAPTPTQVKAGQDNTGAAALRVISQAVSATGTQTVASGAVTAGTRYLHYMHEDAAGNQSAVVSSASFVVSASGPTINTQPANQTATAPTAATFSVVATASAGALTYQWQRQPAAGGGYSNISGATVASYTTGATSVTGGSHNNGDTYRVNVTDSNGTVTSAVATLTVNAPPPGLTSSPLKDNTGALHLGAAFEAFVLNATTGALVVRKTSLTSHVSTGVVTFTDAALTAATQYRVVWRRTDNGAQGVELLTAA